MLAKLHHLALVLESDSPRIREEWRQLYAPFLVSAGPLEDAPVIVFHLELVPQVPPVPAGLPIYSEPDLVIYPCASGWVIHLPSLGQLRVSPAAGRLEGVVAGAVLDTYGAFEDVCTAGLAPLLRRHRRVLLHAFAAAHRDRALLLTGDCASGKTTTGLALLSAGWKHLANDSTLLGERQGQVVAFAYPGRLGIHPGALRRIPALESWSDRPGRPGWKLALDVESLFPSPWQWSAPVAAVCLLRLEPEASEHRAVTISPAEALGRLLPHSVDRWDGETLPLQIDLLQQLVRQAPAYLLHLCPDVPALPAVLEALLVGG